MMKIGLFINNFNMVQLTVCMMHNSILISKNLGVSIVSFHLLYIAFVVFAFAGIKHEHVETQVLKIRSLEEKYSQKKIKKLTRSTWKV
jgi:hypothetical protein